MPMLCSPKWTPSQKPNSRLPKRKAKQWNYTRLSNKTKECCAQGHLIRTRLKTNLVKKERRSEEVKRMFWILMCLSVMINLNSRSKRMTDRSLAVSSINSQWSKDHNWWKMCRKRQWNVCKPSTMVNLNQLLVSNRFPENHSTTLITSPYPAWNLFSSMCKSLILQTEKSKACTACLNLRN